MPKTTLSVRLAVVLALSFSLPSAAQKLEGKPKEDPSLSTSDPSQADTGQDRTKTDGDATTSSGSSSTGATTSSGDLSISADHQEQTPDGTYVFDGNVRIVYKDLEIQADRVEIEKERRQVAAEGNVLVISGKMRLSGARAEIDLDSQTGSIFDGYAVVDPNFIVHGERLDKVSAERFILYDGTITACDQAIPQWSLRASKANIKIEGYARLTNARFKIKKLPVFYTPYLIWPVKRDRSTGFLIPHIGSSQSRGRLISEAFYLVLGRSADATLYADWYEKSGVAPGLQLRYAPAEGVSGEVYGFYLKDKRDDSQSWRYSVNHQQRLGPYFRLVANANVVKDETYFENFERNLSNYSNRTSFWSVFLSGNLGNYSLNLRGEDRDNFFTFFRTDPATGELVTTADTISTGKLPELSVTRRDAKLLGPLYFGFEASAANLSRSVSSSDYDATYGRYDAHPRFSLNFRGLPPWLTITPRFGARFTRWTKSQEERLVDPANPLLGTETVVLDEPVDRKYGEVALEIVGPSFAKIWDVEKNGEHKKRKHLIEPHVTYSYISSIDNLDAFPKGDGGDYILPLNEVKYGIDSRFFVKRRYGDDPDPLQPPIEYHYIYDATCNCYQKRPKDSATNPSGQLSSFGEQVFEAPPDTDESVFELLRVSLFQRYSLDPGLFTDYGRLYNYAGSVFIPNEAQKQFSPLTLQVSYYPNRYSSATANIDYDTQDSKLVRGYLSAQLRDKKRRWLELSFVENAEFLQRQLRASIGWHFSEERYRFEIDQYYDLQNSIGDTGLKQQRYLINYNAQCVGFIVEYSKFNFTGANDYEVRFAITLPSVGTFLDLKRGSSGLFQGNRFGGSRGTPF